MTLGMAIRTLRESRNWNQLQLAKKIGKQSGGQISRWENNRERPQSRNIDKLNKVFGVDIEEYARTEGEAGPPENIKILTGGLSGHTADLSNVDIETLASLAQQLIRLHRALLAELYSRGIDVEDDYVSPGGPQPS